MSDLLISDDQLMQMRHIACHKHGIIGSDIVSDFVYAYYRHTPTMTIEGYSLDNLVGMALHHRYLLENCLIAQSPKFLVFNAENSADAGFDSPHSILQLVSIDRPFLTDTILMILEELSIDVHRIHTAIVDIKTDDNKITHVAPAQTSNSSLEGLQMALVHCEIKRQDDKMRMEIVNKLIEKLSILDVITDDFAAMKARLEDIKAEINQIAIPEVFHKKADVSAFLAWILADNFIFMGFREYRFNDDLSSPALHSVGGSGLGILRNSQENLPSNSFDRLPETLKIKLTEPRVLVFSKSGHIAPVHRPAYMDFVGIQKFDKQGQLIGEYRFLGLLTSRAYQTNLEQVPMLREKSQAILDKARLPKNSHSYTKLLHIINTLPRDDFYQATIDELYATAIGISNLHNKNTLKLFSRTDHYGRFVSCLVYIPRHKFDTKLRQKIQQLLMNAYHGNSVGISTQYNDTSHTRVHAHVRTNPENIVHVDEVKLEAQLNALLYDWQDSFESEINQQNISLSPTLKHTLSEIPMSYKEDFDVADAVGDVVYFNQLLCQKDDVILWNVAKHPDHKSLALKVYGKRTPKALSTILPILEDFGVVVVSSDTYEFGQNNQPNNNQPNNTQIWLQNYTLTLKNVDSIDLPAVKAQFEETLGLIQQGLVESDRLNELVLTTDLSAYDVVVLRALSYYMVQATAPFSVDYIFETLLNNRTLSQSLIRLFGAKFSPTTQDQTNYQQIIEQIHVALNDIASLDEDRIIRWLLDLIQAMVRTNFYQTDDNGHKKDRLSFKFKASDITHLPKPKPMFEIFVYSPKVEGVHLRGGKVARGGLRWSDRMEDYRTEVLGLVKAQMVKNAVIVPVGSKGGFVVKDKSKQVDRETWQKEGIACYQTYIRGLLDITDNLVNGKVVPPANTVRHDEDDPYLVVAADKGTATFSDIANALSAEYNFWLQDAFASGGSAGYDHKGMGITAKGAWESVKRHFRLMGKDIQNIDNKDNQFSVIGIGDMSGDVFGNGMLLSQNIRLLAAFNHLHIFIDPNPDALTSFYERDRLFHLPRSSWIDYNSDLISTGGGVFSRQDKAIAITPQMKKAFAIDEDSLTPNELLHKLLKAPVDLIWNGGIGTYIKACDEEHADVGDRANDAIRVNGNQVRAKVVGEGGNLGYTQKGRIEYALNGGRIYTDAIDNSGGVNCSDHEVNIKILLGAVVERGDMTIKQRNDLLAQMTDTVAQLVLRQNYLQPQAIELSAYLACDKLSEQARFIQFLENQGKLDRAIEFLPSDDVLASRQKASQGLTNPELAVLLAYGKMWVYDEMLASDLPDNTYFLEELKKYFPKELSQLYFDEMTKHRLHREIICTYLTNGLVNRLGLEIIFSLYDEMGFSISQIAHAYAIVRDVFGVQSLWDKLIALDNKLSANLQLAIESDIRQSFKVAITWFLSNNANLKDVSVITYAFKEAVNEFTGNDILYQLYFDKNIHQQADKLTKQGVPTHDAQAFAQLFVFVKALDVVALSDKYDAQAQQVADGYFGVHQAIQFEILMQYIQRLPANSHWDKRALGALSVQANRLLSDLTQSAITEGFDSWQYNRHDKLARFNQELNAIANDVSLASLSVIISQLADLKNA